MFSSANIYIVASIYEGRDEGFGGAASSEGAETENKTSDQPLAKKSESQTKAGNQELKCLNVHMSNVSHVSQSLVFPMISNVSDPWDMLSCVSSKVIVCHADAHYVCDSRKPRDI